MSQYLDPNRRERAPIEDWADGFEIIPARSTTEVEPARIIPIGEATTVRTYTKIDGTVSELALRMWYYVGGTWYQGSSTGDSVADALHGDRNEARDWDVRGCTLVGFTIDTIAGGGTVAVTAEGII